jgi:hypothetical protein
MIVPEFQGHLGSGTSIAAVLFLKEEEETAKGQIRQVLFIVTTNSCMDIAVCTGALSLVNQTLMVLHAADLFPQTL